MELPGAFKVLDTFMISYIHGEDWPNHVFATAICDDFTFVAKTEPGTSHAEEKVLDHFRQLLTTSRLPFPKIKLFLSASPCGLCSKEIIRFVHETRLHLEIVFAGLYRIRRPSCVRNPDCRGHLTSDDEHTVNVDGLKKLYWTQSVDLHTFTGEDWYHLKEAVGVPSYDCTSRQKEDLELRMDFEEIMEIRPSASFLEPAFPVEPSRLERSFHWQTARDSSLYESHSRPFMNNQMNLSTFHDHVNYESWDPCTHETSTYPVRRPRDLGHLYTAYPAPAGHYIEHGV